MNSVRPAILSDQCPMQRRKSDYDLERAEDWKFDISRDSRSAKVKKAPPIMRIQRANLRHKRKLEVQVSFEMSSELELSSNESVSEASSSSVSAEPRAQRRYRQHSRDSLVSESDPDGIVNVPRQSGKLCFRKTDAVVGERRESEEILFALAPHVDAQRSFTIGAFAQN